VSENKQRNIGAVLVTLGIICAAILTLLDYKIKNDLIHAAMQLDRNIREFRREVSPNIVDNADDSVSGTIPMYSENHNDASLEMEIHTNEVPESPEVQSHGQTRDNRGRFQAKGE
jgi:hypothetical protein